MVRIRNSGRRALAAAATCAVLATGFAAVPGFGFTTQVTPGLVAVYVRLFGSGGRVRIVTWAKFAEAHKGTREIESLITQSGMELGALQTVNSYFNREPFLSDESHWGFEDYWATPAEMQASNGGDCEDFSIAKYFILKEFGVPVERLRITYVKAVKINQAHMVLAYYPTPGAVPLILDNLEDRVRVASERPDLVPVYSFNDDDVVLVRDGRKANPMQIRTWRNLLEKLEWEARL